MIERIPPHNIDAERAVLGAAMDSKDALYNVLEVIKSEDFYQKSHREIFDAILSLYRKNISVDILTVTEELNQRNALEMAGGRAYLAELTSDVPSTGNAGQYAKIIAEKASLRGLIDTSSDIIEKCYREETSTNAILDFAESRIFGIAQSRQSRDMIPISDVMMENLNQIDEACKKEGEVTGLTTGFRDIDAKLSGLQKSDLIVLAARPAMGKTAFALNVAQQAAVKGNASVAIFSLEMSSTQLGQRLLSMESKIESEKLKKGTLNRSDWESLNRAIDVLAKAKIYIDDTPGIGMIEIKNKCRRLKAEKGLDLVVVDYLQLMRADTKAESRQQEVSNLTRNLKLLARELDCPIIVLSQLSRGPESTQRGKNHRPMLSDLRDSGSIEQDADIVIFLYRDDYYNEDTPKPGICEVIIAKHRAGSTGTVELAWLSKYTRFADQDKSQLSNQPFVQQSQQPPLPPRI